MNAIPPTHSTNTTVLLLGGAVERSLALDLQAVHAYETTTISPFDLICFSTGRFIRHVPSYRGVLLRTLLDAAGVRRPDNADFKRTVFLARAQDGYSVTFSWHELFNSPIGDSALVAYECGDRPLDDEDGPFLLVSGADRVRAPRHVKRLACVDTFVIGSSSRT